jgi:hypothetical protein
MHLRNVAESEASIVRCTRIPIRHGVTLLKCGGNGAVTTAPKMLPIVAQSIDEFKCGLRIHAVNDFIIMEHSRCNAG